MSELPIRLPPHVHPRHYRLALDLDPTQAAYLGEVEITLALDSPASALELHAVDLQIDRAVVESGGAEQRCAVRLEAERDRLHVTFARPLDPGPVKLTLAFRGQLQSGLRGLYRVVDQGRSYAFTQFEPADARRAFPCFDEPAHKAIFEVRLTVPDGLDGLSNGALLTTEPVGEGRKELHFAPTPPLSPYLVAVAVGAFAQVEGRSGATPVRVLATPGKEALGQLALDMAIAFLPILEDYFGSPYPYGKLDLLAAPDFEAGAMENAGLILFRESLLLLDPATASLDAQRQVAITTAHEMAHQWFGNLVTMEWWDDLWLNEAFATWMEFRVVDAWRPGWQLWTDFERMKAVPLHLDSLQHTRPIQAAVRSPEQANEMFDGITYNKGAAVLRMFEIFLGEVPFRAGVRAYLAKHAGGNAQAAALWEALSAASGQPVAELAESWFTRPGYPLVSIDFESGRAQVAQQRFFARAGGGESSAPWALPLAFKVRRADGTLGRTTHLLRTAHGEVELHGAELAFGNAEGSGFYRVAYAPATLAAIASQPQDLAPVEQVSLLADQWAQVRSGSPLPPQLDLLAAFGRGPVGGLPPRTVLETAIAQLGALDDVVLAEGARPAFQRWVGGLLGPHLDALGLDPRVGETADVQLLRPRLAEAVGRLGDAPALRQDLGARLDRWLAGEPALPSSLLGVALRLAAQRGDAALWERFRQRMAAAHAPEEHDRFLLALAAFERPELVERSLALGLGDEVRSQDLQTLLGALFSNRAARAACWRFVRERWTAVACKAPVFGLRRIVSATAALVDPGWRAEVEAFFSDPAHHVEAGERELRQALEAIDLGLGLRHREQLALSTWLAARSS